MLTDTAWNTLKKLSSLDKVGASQYIEKIIRKLGVTESAHDSVSFHPMPPLRSPDVKRPTSHGFSAYSL